MGAMSIMQSTLRISAFRRISLALTRGLAWFKPDPSQPRRLWMRLGLVILLAWVVFGGQRGFLKLVSLQREKWRLQAEIGDLGRQNLALSERIRELGSHPAFYEKKAREELMLAKPGEIIYRFNQDGQP